MFSVNGVVYPCREVAGEGYMGKGGGMGRQGWEGI